ncbi:biotin synthase BioB [uncultured Alistipes sp.]|uniref:biotin synthase BioB n=1 Tax=uncultured Alistipes sp. TaxID=538949 RepID=UPI002614605C|nr:biotin synthase BioB [uncultured Alistipes sp.]
MMKIDDLEQELAGGYRLDYDGTLELLRTTSDDDLCALAGRLRTRYRGKRFDTCSIMNARSGRCSEDCKWCAQSKYHRTAIDVYPLVDEQAARKEARYHADKGVRRFSLVTSGRTLTGGETERICSIYRRIASETDIALCASLGLLDREQLRRLRESGVRRYHCNLETAPSFFPSLCSTHTTEQKLRTIAWAREAGLEICCGGIIGMGETEEQRVEFALAVRDTGAVSIPVNVLNPIPGTPLENLPPLTDSEVLRTMAMMRIVHPEADIRLAGGRNRIKHLEARLFACGVSASIVGDLLTTAGSDIDTDRRVLKNMGFEL